MSLSEAVTSGIDTYRRATEGKLRERAILVYSILEVATRAELVEALIKADPDNKKPVESTLRRLVIRTTRQMGLPDFPTGAKGGRPSFDQCEHYRRENCAKWISANGGMPRDEQLADPNWDLRPQPLPMADSIPKKSLPEQNADPVRPELHSNRGLPQDDAIRMPESFQGAGSVLEAETGTELSRRHREKIKLPVIGEDSFEQIPAPPLNIPVDVPSGDPTPLRSELHQDRRK